MRKILNFGHTLGHAIETYFLNNLDLDELLHGEAIVIGMIMESFISNKLNMLNDNDLETISQSLIEIYGKVIIPKDKESEIISLLKFDKKNSHGNINFVLLNGIGNPKIDCNVQENLIRKHLIIMENYKKASSKEVFYYNSLKIVCINLFLSLMLSSRDIIVSVL